MNGIFLPIILPDEFGSGFLDLVCRVNNTSKVDLIRALRDAGTRTRTHAGEIAVLAGMSELDFVRRHSLRPFYEMFCDDRERGKNLPERIYRSNIFSNRDQALSFCKECSLNDVETWGRSYWRRLHQAPGMWWCLEHKTPLMRHPATRLCEQPHTLADLEQTWIDECFPVPARIESRYMQIVARMLATAKPISISRMIDCLWQGDSLRTWNLGKEEPLLSDTVFRMCSSKWWSHVLGDPIWKRHGQYFSKIDGFLNLGGGQAIGRILAIAVLFELEHDLYSTMDYCSNETTFA